MSLRAMGFRQHGVGSVPPPIPHVIRVGAPAQVLNGIVGYSRRSVEDKRVAFRVRDERLRYEPVDQVSGECLAHTECMLFVSSSINTPLQNTPLNDARTSGKRVRERPVKRSNSPSVRNLIRPFKPRYVTPLLSHLPASPASSFSPIRSPPILQTRDERSRHTVGTSRTPHTYCT